MKYCMLRAYTRQPDVNCYPDGLARSIHFTLTVDGKETPLNHGYGMLFTEAEIDGLNRISPRCLKDPRINVQPDGGWLITATRTLEDGSAEDNGGKVRAWETEDFCTFRSLGMIDPPAAAGTEEAELPETLVPGMLHRWNDAVGYPLPICTERPEGFPFPLMKGYGDPVCHWYRGNYYYMATNDNTDNIGFYIRKSPTMQGLFDGSSPETLLMGVDEEKGFIQTFWAPEFHEINGKLYLLFAISGKKWGPQCHIMELKEDGDPADPNNWLPPKPVLRMDGSPLAGEDAITLDMTCFRTDRLYAVWSYREHIGTELDTGSMLMIALLDEERPWRLASEPVLLSRPLFGWENMGHTINNEAPNAWFEHGRILLGFSGGAAAGYSYVVGVLTADEKADLLDPASWQKSGTPALCFASIEGEYGPGHHSFFFDAEGQPWILYHTVQGFGQHLRCPVIHRMKRQ